jgi:hypothetical protein
VFQHVLPEKLETCRKNRGFSVENAETGEINRRFRRLEADQFKLLLLLLLVLMLVIVIGSAALVSNAFRG